MYIILDLNHYVKQTVLKILHPLLLENGCKDFKISTTSWKFEKHWSEPDKEEWGELTKYKVEETQKRQTIPVHGKLKIHEGNIYLQVYIKYWNLREVTSEAISNIANMKYEYKQKQVMLSADEGNKKVQYYSCTMLLGNFTKDKMTNRSQKATLNFGIHIQDLRIQCGEQEYKLYKNFRELLTYLNTEQYEESVKFLKSRNREVKLEGLSRKNTNKDPRNWFNDTEIQELEKDKQEIEKTGKTRNGKKE